MGKHKRITVTDEIQRINLYEIPNKLEDLIKMLQDIQPKNYSNLTVSTEGQDYEGLDYLIIHGERIENDKEYNARVERIKKHEEKKKQEKMNQLQKTEARILQLQKEAEKLRKQTQEKKSAPVNRLQSV